jgi:large subunit ribosomal protein L32
MPVPRRRHCSARQGKGRSHIKLLAKQLIPCENCGELKMRHRICPSCGTYKKVAYKATTTTPQQS